MITPQAIQDIEFSKSRKGYDEREVDEFLDRITLDLERILEENNRLKIERRRMIDELTKYKQEESSVLETLETAKALMGDIAVSAEKRAQILLKNAELDAQLIQREAKESVERLMEENSTLGKRVSDFRDRYKGLLESELRRFDTLATELFSEFGIDDLPGPAIARRAGLNGQPRTAIPSPSDTQIIAGDEILNAEKRKRTVVNMK